MGTGTSGLRHESLPQGQGDPIPREMQVPPLPMVCLAASKPRMADLRFLNHIAY